MDLATILALLHAPSAALVRVLHPSPPAPDLDGQCIALCDGRGMLVPAAAAELLIAAGARDEREQ